MPCNADAIALSRRRARPSCSGGQARSPLPGRGSCLPPRRSSRARSRSARARGGCWRVELGSAHSTHSRPPPRTPKAVHQPLPPVGARVQRFLLWPEFCVWRDEHAVGGAEGLLVGGSCSSWCWCWCRSRSRRRLRILGFPRPRRPSSARERSLQLAQGSVVHGE